MKSKAKNYVWVVEVRGVNRWSPCADCDLDEAGGERALKWWRDFWPDEEFRLRKYVST